MLRIIKNLLLVVCLLIAVFTVAHFALALDTWGGDTGGANFQATTGLGGGDLRITIANIIRIVLGFLGILAVCLIIYAGWLWMTAAGNEEKIEQAKKILINAVIGLVIILASFAIASFILNSLISVTGSGGDGSVCNPLCGEGQHCCASVCISSATPCDSVVPPGGDSFRIISTVPRDSDTGVIRNVVVRMYFNKEINISVDQTVLGDNLKVEKISTIEPVTKAETAVNPVQLVDGIKGITANRRQINFKASAACGNPQNTLNCLDQWSKYRVTVNGFSGIKDVNGVGLSCGPGFNCQFIFSTDDTIDISGPDSGIVPRQMCKDDGTLASIPSANLVDGWAKDDIGVADIRFCSQEPGGSEECFNDSIKTGGLGQTYLSHSYKYNTSGYKVGDDYTFRVKASDLAGQLDQAEFITEIRPGHCCNGIKDGTETDIDCGGECGACDGGACATDISIPTNNNNCSANNNLCASQFCTSQNSGVTSCQDAGYAAGTTSCCLCRRPPVITGVFPAGGFCDGSPNTACLKDGDCASGVKTCNKITPNGAVGNFVTIVGRNFGASAGKVYFKNGAAGGDWGEAQLANDKDSGNNKCANSWSDTQIIVIVPAGAVNGPIKVETVSGFSDDSRANPALSDFLINTISRPGLCQLENNKCGADQNCKKDHGLLNDAINYYGVRLTAGNEGYFGSWDQRVKALSSIFPGASDKAGSAAVPNITTGRTTSFVMEGNIYSNYLNFTKDAEPYAGPVISSFDPREGSAGQYVTINGRGFGNTRGSSKVYFGDSLTGTEASYDFPKVCADSIWSDKQVIVKVPAGLPDSDYKITMKIGAWPAINTDSLSPSTFEADSTLPLAPSLCKINPIIGKVNSTVNLYGEYFGNKTTTVLIGTKTYPLIRFQANKDQSEGNISFWKKIEDADNAITTVHAQAVTGPVKVVQTKTVQSVVQESVGNGLNFTVGVCSANAECGSGNLCCSAGTPYAGECKAFRNDAGGRVIESTEQGLCFPQIKSCVYEWNFSTGGNGVGDPCYNGAASGVCDITKSRCGAPLTCDTASCTCRPSGVCLAPNTPCPASPSLMLNCCNSSQTCIQATGQCETISESCSGYGNQCADSYFCPNSPGQCSANAGGQAVDCSDDACNNFTQCGKDNCAYVSGLNKCVEKDASCDLTKNVSYTLGPVNYTGKANCLPYNNQNRWIMAINTSCPVGWTNIGNNRCIEGAAASGRTCSVCAAGFKCSMVKAGDPGVCAVDQTICSTGSNCIAGKCDKKDSPSCDCCCRRANDNQDCCAPLTCEGACGAETATTVNPQFGQCTGCTVAGNQVASNATCNCAGTSGKFCDTAGAGGQGVCKDCAQLSTAQSCSGLGEGTCCFDAKNNNACRGGTGPYAIGAAGDTNNYCAYYNCDTGNNANKCKTDLPLKNGSYRTTTCDNKCSFPPQFGRECVKVMPAPAPAQCDASICAGFSCLNNTYLTVLTPPNSCGICCCDPNKTGSDSTNLATYDKCKNINTNLSCWKNRGNCSGNNRGLCCGCSKDSDCGDAATTGCGADTCCQARPSVIDGTVIPRPNNYPQPSGNNVCRNALIQATFNQSMQIDTFSGNVIVAADYEDKPCPAGTEYLTAVYKPTGLVKIKYWLAGLPLVNRFFASEARALAGNFCAVTGLVSGYNTINNQQTVLEFKLQKLLEPSRKYYVIIKGDADITDALSNGVLSEAGIGMSQTNTETFNGVTFKGKIWSFTTRGTQAPNNGVCTIDHAEIAPVSYLFQTNKDDLKDNDATDTSTFDKIDDSDLVYRARAIAADGSILNPLPLVYDWDWTWISAAPTIFGVPIISGLPEDGNQRLVQADPKVTEGKSVITATAELNAGGRGTYPASATAYLMVCDNPWPPVDNNGFWYPWNSDPPSNCLTGPGTCPNTNFEVYYCRDAGGAGTADDLPAISDEAVIRGSSNEILKEFYFFREGLPDMTDKTLATTTNFEIRQGSKAGLIWPVVSGATGYKIYYGTASGNYTNSVATSTNGIAANPQIISGLTNGRKYYFALTSYNDKKAESAYSNETTAIPADTLAPAIPKNFMGFPQVSSTAVISWLANTDDTVNYKVYYGGVSGYLGAVVTVNKSQCSSSLCQTTIINLNPGATYYYAVTALDASNRESNKSQEKSLTMVVSSANRRRADLLKIMSALFRYADDHGGVLPDYGVSCLGVQTGSRCWNGYSNHNVYSYNGFPGNTALNDALAPYLSPIPLDPLYPRLIRNNYIAGNTDPTKYLDPYNPPNDIHWPADYQYNIGDAYLYFKGTTDFGCNGTVTGHCGGVATGVLCQIGRNPPRCVSGLCPDCSPPASCTTIVNENAGNFLVWQSDDTTRWLDDTTCTPGRRACCGNISCGPVASYFCALGIDKIYKHQEPDGW